jgi:FMN phosphatase YigB (HAD superfamily)
MPPLYRYSKSAGPAPLVWIDVDDTVLDFTRSHAAGVRAVERWAVTHVGPDKASRFAAAFDRGFRVSLAGGHRAPSPAEAAWQSNVERRMERVAAEGPRPTRWAREIWLEVAAEECGVKPAREALAEAAALYWQALTEDHTLHEGVVDTLRELRARGYRMALVTASDARLTPGPDGWRYEPAVSLRLKEQRLHRVLHPLMAFAERLVIGDPYEKTGPEFYEKVLRDVPLEAGGMVITVGDSPASDLLLARATATAVRFGVLCDPHRRWVGELPEGADLRVEQLYELLMHFF